MRLSFPHEQLKRSQVYLLIDQPLGMPLDGGHQRERGIFKRFDDPVRRGRDDLESPAELLNALLVVAVD